MTQDRLPAWYHAGSPARPDASAVARPGPPLHRPRQLDFAENAPDRHEAWERISPGVRDRVDGKVGRRLEWWAQEIDGRVHATVLGTRGLVVLSPTVNRSNQPATEIRTIRLDESSLRSVRINTAGSGSGVGGPVPSQPVGPPDSRLNGSMAGFLGWLPARAQQLMQDPFGDRSRELYFDHYYCRFGTTHSIGGAPLHIWAYITDHQVVTFCAGIGYGFRDSAGAASWDLTCWRLDVERGPR